MVALRRTIDEALSGCKVPIEPIGLQAQAILFGGIHAKAKHLVGETDTGMNYKDMIK